MLFGEKKKIAVQNKNDALYSFDVFPPTVRPLMAFTMCLPSEVINKWYPLEPAFLTPINAGELLAIRIV